MAHEVHSKEIDEDQPVVGQERPPVEEPPAPDAGASESRQKATPAGVPSAAAPTPPSVRLAASIQRMPPARRWALGLALAFLSTLSWAGVVPGVVGAMIALVLAAGFVLSSWWAMVPAAIAAAAGALVGSWVNVHLAPAGSIEGTGWGAVMGVLLFAAMLLWIPFFCFLAAGVGMSKYLQSQAPPTRKGKVSWIVVLCSVIVGVLFIWLLDGMPELLRMPPTGWVLGLLPGILSAIMAAAPCLLAGWLLRSVKGFLVTPLVYAGAVLVSIVVGSGFSLAEFVFLLIGLVFYILLPAGVMSALGTALGGGFSRSSANESRIDRI